MALAGFSTYRIAASTSTGAQALSTPVNGETIKGAIVEVTRGLTANVVANHMVATVGISDGTNVRSMSARSEDNVNPSDAGRRYGRNFIEIVNRGGNSADGVASFASFGSNVVNINWSNAPAAAYLMLVTVFWGDLMECHAGQLSSAATIGGTASLTGLPFAPTALFAWSHQGGFPTTSVGANHCRFHHGAAVYNESDNTIEQVHCHMHERDNLSVATGLGNTFRDDCVLQDSTINGAGSPTFNERAELTAFKSDGWTLTTRDVAAACTGMFFTFRPGNNRLMLSTQDLETSVSGSAGAAKKITTGWRPAAARAFASGFNRI